ncbi:MAG: DUF3883 domain-containing protein [Prevotellaceae bacterium]|nr:DUF3883 domain-containing protein [Candidatus Faecinaster equi]
MDDILLTHDDLNIILEMSQKEYPSHAIPETDSSKETFLNIRRKLHKVMNYMADYFCEYGEFARTKADGNPVPRKSNKLGEVWAAFYIGKDKKQSKQIFIHYNTTKKTIDVGFCFGFGINKLSSQLSNCGKGVYEIISKNKQEYENLMCCGFKTYYGDWKTDAQQNSKEDWLLQIQTNPATYRIVKSFSKDVSRTTLIATISQLIFLMQVNNELQLHTKSNVTKEDRICIYQRLLDIGEKGEMYVFLQEHERIRQLFPTAKYPYHKSKESDNYGYDILSLDSNGQEIYIEVKTTTLKKDNPQSRSFPMSSKEYEMMQTNQSSYFIYRVFDVDGTPQLEKYKYEDIDASTDGYVISPKK